MQMNTNVSQSFCVKIILVLIVLLSACTTYGNSKPNIVVIISDDQGFADISFNPHHAKEVSTPHMDALAKEGIWFSQAYISGNVCSPTRLGLMTGQYQQRFGVYTAGEGGTGIDPNGLTIYICSVTGEPTDEYKKYIKNV